jgi:hypothetical protein
LPFFNRKRLIISLIIKRLWFYAPSVIGYKTGFFDNKVRAFVRKTRGKQLGRVLFVKEVGGVPPQYFA